MSLTLSAPSRPLCVDLDGTLLATDALWESLLLLARKRPTKLVGLPLWLLRGKAHFKRRVADEVVPDPRVLPYRDDVLALIAAEKQAGREVVLATASDVAIARSVADHLGLFDAVLASDGRTNLSGARKAEALRAHCADRGFDYIGDSSDDVPVWSAADGAILVDPPARLLRRAERSATVRAVLRGERGRVRDAIRAMRPHQWIKNTLLVVPLILGHKLGEPALLLNVLLAFVAFSLCASSVYITNDLLDLEADRAHPRKRSRPFASGALPIRTGVLMVPTLLAAGFALSAAVLPPIFTTSLGVYIVLTTAYSTYVKQVMLLDVFLLAGLYTLRVLSGGSATGIAISPWLAAFSLFFFTSLAFLKRYSELRFLDGHRQASFKRRDYSIADAELLRAVGPAGGYLSVLVLALYINSTEVLELYDRPEALWLVIPLFLYWITRIWFLAHRGEVEDDPIVFTVKDRVSYIIGALVAVTLAIASI